MFDRSRGSLKSRKMRKEELGKANSTMPVRMVLGALRTGTNGSEGIGNVPRASSLHRCAVTSQVAEYHHHL